MANDYYDPTAVDVPSNVRARSAHIDNVSLSVETAFDKLPTEAEIKDGRVSYGTESGSGNTYTVALPYTPASLVEGLTVEFKATHANTGACTLNCGVGGAKAVKRPGGGDLQTGDISTDDVVGVRYNGTWFMLIYPFVPLAVSFRGALVSHIEDVTAIPDSTFTALSFESESYDTDGFHDNVTNNTRLSVGSGMAIVKLAAGLYLPSPGTSAYVSVVIRKNGSLLIPGIAGNSFSGPSGTIYLSAQTPPLSVVEGDYFEVVLYQTTGDNLSLVYSIGEPMWFSIEVIE